VHKALVVACLRIQEMRRARTEVRRFGTTTAELLQLHRWLSEANCTHVAIESTSIYWKPVFNVLEGSLEVVLANAYHVKAVPGRKTDVKDCEWLADLLAHGLIRASFIPPPEIRALRDLWLLKMRYVLPPLMFASFLDTLRADDFRPGLTGRIVRKLASVACRAAA
jgi:transposase